MSDKGNILHRIRQALARDLERHREESDAVRGEMAELRDDIVAIRRTLERLEGSINRTNNHQSSIQHDLNNLAGRFTTVERGYTNAIMRVDRTLSDHLGNPAAHDPQSVDLLDAFMWRLANKLGYHLEEL